MDNFDRSKSDRPCPSVVDRYFTKGYSVNLPKGFKPGDSPNHNDVCVLKHSNRLCVITLSYAHPLVKNKKSVKVESISFKVSKKVDRALNQVSGKRKRGAHWLDARSPLCIVTCSDDSSFTIYSGIRGSLIEMNDRLIKDPTLLQRMPQTEGYIAIVMPKLVESPQIMEGLMGQQDYDDYVTTIDSTNTTNINGTGSCSTKTDESSSESRT